MYQEGLFPLSTSCAPGQVKYADLWGLREGKYAYLAAEDVRSTEWQELDPVPPYFFFIPKDFDLLDEYEQGWSVIDLFGTGNPRKDRGKCWGSGVKTNRDRLLIDSDRRVLEDRIQILADTRVSDEEVRSRFGLKDSRYWNTSRERQKIRDVDWCQEVVSYFYRPFDTRWVLYQPNLIEIGRGGASKFVMRHMLRDNLSVCTMRQVVGDPFRHIFVSNTLNDMNVLTSHHVSQVTFPLYLYPDDEEVQKKLEPEEGRSPNLNPEFVKAVEEKLDLRFMPDGQGDLKETFGPEDVFYYAYAIFHSPTYRARYEELLKIDFPRLPLTSNRELFAALVERGAELASLHLMESPALEIPVTTYPVGGSDRAEKVRYVEPHKEAGEEILGRVYINKEQYYEGVEPDVWAFHIGGYQVLHKWLKDRRGRKLSIDDLEHYQKIVVALKETMRLMEEIDTLIPSWPLR